jgi:hypothetical protein
VEAWYVNGCVVGLPPVTPNNKRGTRGLGGLLYITVRSVGPKKSMIAFTFIGAVCLYPCNNARCPPALAPIKTNLSEIRYSDLLL